MWFLMGDTNIKYLVENGCHIWDGDAIKNYERHSGKIHPHRPKQEYFEDLILNDDKFAKEWGDLGPIYGKQWRAFDEEEWGGIDQIQNLINDLKTNPDSRRLMVTAWNPSYQHQMVLPPCHYGFQVYTRELSSDERYNLLSESEKKNFIIAMRPMMSPDDKYDEVHYTIDNYYEHIPKRAISLMWNQRSVDTFLGLPFNIASYGLLLEIIAKAVNMVPDQLIGNLGDVHLYNNHIEQAKEQIERESFDLPTLKHLKADSFYESLSEDQSLYSHLENTDFELVNYQSHPAIKAPLSN
jgi:thymidylate synthase